MTIFKPEERKIFEDKNFVSVATLGKDGTPRNTAIWVDLDGDDVLLNGAESRGWLKNLQRNPHVALSVYDLKNPYHQVTVQGEVTSISTEGGEDHIDKLAQKYWGTLYNSHDPNDPRNIIRIKVKTINGRKVE
jgi:PPOX class probable F420-dependent enzyme